MAQCGEFCPGLPQFQGQLGGGLAQDGSRGLLGGQALPGVGQGLGGLGATAVGIFRDIEQAAGQGVEDNIVEDVTQQAENFADQETGGGFDSEI